MSDTMTRSISRNVEPAQRPSLVRRMIREGMTHAKATSVVYGFSAEDIEDRETTSDLPRIKIGGAIFNVSETRSMDGNLAEIETEEGEHFVLAESSEAAGEAARARWADMAKNDKHEFVSMVGEEAILDWARGEYGGPGTSKVASLEEWLDLYLDAPAEEFAGYDGEEREVERVGNLRTELGFTPTVAYRTH